MSICPCQGQGKEAIGLGAEWLKGPSKAGEQAAKAAHSQDAEMLKKPAHSQPGWHQTRLIC